MADVKHNRTIGDFGSKFFGFVPASRRFSFLHNPLANHIRRGARLVSDRFFQRNQFRKRVSPRSFSFAERSSLPSASNNVIISSTMSRRRSRKRRRNGNSSSMHVAKRALKKVKRLERKQEVKIYDIVLTTIAAVDTTGDTRSMSSIAQGDFVSSRDGEKISPFFFQLRINWQGIAAGVDEVYRTIIFQDRRQVLGAIPAVLDVLLEGNPLSLFNKQNRGRFKILYDETFTGISDTALRQSHISLVSRKMSGPIQWNGSSSTAWTKNGLFMINISNATANKPAVTFTFRLFYNDN